jgi:threonine dehydrogenase-like Zn-dependent dehydrogenase
MSKMRANVFRGKNDIRVEEVERPRAGVGEAVNRVTLTTICGTDLHIRRGAYPVRPGLVIGVAGGANRLAMARRMGADVVLGYRAMDGVLKVAFKP